MKTPLHIYRWLSLFFAAGALLPAVAFGQEVIFEDDFDGIPADSSPTIPPWTHVNDQSGWGVLQARADFNDFFGKGPGNQYLEFSSRGTNIVLAADEALGEGHEILTFSFDFYEPDGWDDSPLVILAYSGPIDVNANRVDRIRLTHGGTGATAPTTAENRVYQLDTLNRADWVINNSSEPLSYAGRVLNPHRSDLWINGRVILSNQTGESAATRPTGPITGFDLRTFSGANQTIYIDDLRVITGAEVRLPGPRIEFKFEGDLVNSGTAGGEGTFIHQRENDPAHNWVWANRPSFGTGLGGRPNSGLDNTQVGGMGNYGQGVLREGGFFFPGTAIRGLESVTVAGWFKTPAETPWSNEAFMVGWPNGLHYNHQSGTGERLILNVPYGTPFTTRQQFSLNNIVEGVTRYQQFTERWTFHAVTFDGTTGTMSFYYAFEDSAGVVHNTTRTGMHEAPLRNIGFDIAFLNNFDGTRPFKGRVDNIRIFGSNEDGSGALSRDALQALWAADLAEAAGAPDAPSVRIIDFSHTGTHFSVSFETDGGATYFVDRSSDLVNWEPVHSTPGDGQVQQYSELVEGQPRQFYRVRAEN